MGDAIDRFSKALASGASRRSALGAFAAGSAALLPWTGEGKNRRQRRRRRRRQQLLKQFAPFLEYCEQWCADKFVLDSKQLGECINSAKTGQGACYSEVDQGPGKFCTKDIFCPAGQICCPDLVGGAAVVSGECCVGNCGVINGTRVCFS